MERKNPADILFSGARKQRFKSARRTQFDIEIFGVRQKTQKQVETLLKRKIIRATFAWVAGGDDDRRGLATASIAAATGQDRHLALEWIEHAAEMIESKLKKVRRLCMVTAKRRSAGEAITPTISWFASLTGLRVII